MEPIMSYTPEEMIFKYGKVEIDFEGCKVFALSSVILWEVPETLLNLDFTFDMAFHLDLEVSLSFVIDNIGDLKFYLRFNTKDLFKYLKKILTGEVRLKLQYCSDIFSYVGDAEGNDVYDLVVREENTSEKFYIIPHSIYEYGLTIGYYNGEEKILKEIICSKCNYRILDVYCTFSAIKVNNLENVLDIIL
ncbi:hypothetical protein Avbf_10759 [Armadillidium vulgare]|nr:hypothetical protein Avbf_10759 [Armadillidium vulgare]